MTSSNSSERLKVSSEKVIVIDQFMLGNAQLLQAVAEAGGDLEKLNMAARSYGGGILSLAKGDYDVLRDPHLQLIVLRPASEGNNGASSEEEDLESIFDVFGPDVQPTFNVLVDTRCIALIDTAIFSRDTVVEKYCELRRSREDKKARDLLRDEGGAVRYGFNHYGDELGLYQTKDLVALWPH